MDNRTFSFISSALISKAGRPETVTYMPGIGNGSNNISDFNNYSGFSPKGFQYPPLDTSGIIRIPLYVLIFILAVLGNTLVIVTLIQNKRMRTVTNVFLLNLSISDLLLAVFCMPFTIIPMLLQNFIFGPTICVMIRYLQVINSNCFELVRLSVKQSVRYLKIHLTVLCLCYSIAKSRFAPGIRYIETGVPVSPTCNSRIVKLEKEISDGIQFNTHICKLERLCKTTEMYKLLKNTCTELDSCFTVLNWSITSLFIHVTDNNTCVQSRLNAVFSLDHFQRLFPRNIDIARSIYLFLKKIA
ncbi:hypothetical protein ACJMK2_030832 [Sinanodonta woodiana]|uniref:G-protein coupled receptors family 1 profile domain-containing protein n=1 Tax=Sinanodonta woodiana TaxID=1069815 RepID=A0ABD3WXI1_SINWO